jgi:hypothetical protein
MQVQTLIGWNHKPASTVSLEAESRNEVRVIVERLALASLLSFLCKMIVLVRN